MGIQVGDTLGDYQVIRRLGAGGMGAVYEARHMISHRTEAIKVLLDNAEEDPDLAERFLREIRLQASLSHPGIAALHTALRHNSHLLMVMEFVQGESLERILRRESVDLVRAIEIVIELLEALAYAHGCGVVHRDIKPANIMLTAEGKVKLLDFGIARLSKDPRLTQTGAAIGSLHYMSPEQLRGFPADQRSDLYSTGMTLYEMVTGERAFASDDAYMIMKAHIEEVPRAPELLNPAVSKELSAAILRAVRKDPEQRFQTAQEFLEVLRIAREKLSNATPTVPRRRMDGARAEISTNSALARFEPERMERVTRELAGFIGPVAKVLVSRAAKQAGSVDQLYEILAANVPAGRDREKFLRSRYG